MAKSGIIGVIADSGTWGDSSIFGTGEKYIAGLRAVTDLTPLIIPTSNMANMDAVLDSIDGLMLTGSKTNIHPARYGTTASTAHEPFDRPRDEAVFQYIPACLQRAIPILGICRGLQEINVAFGGSLVAALHEIDGRLDHREAETADKDKKHAPRHQVSFPENGLFADWAGQTTLQVNSLHRQGIDRLGNELSVEATAEDGTIEGIASKDASHFVVAVQWHPEYKAAQNSFACKFFGAFERAVKSTQK